MDTVTRIQTLDVTVGTNTLEKGMNPIILPPSIDKRSGKLSSLNLVGQPV